ncbi:MAG: NAD(+) diphosphatase [Clostridia bacterium]|nr:NAD(+) diphosphatase [Clostridia bacterium]
MIQDIAPSRLNIAYAPEIPCAEDTVLLFDETGRLCVRIQGGALSFPASRDIPMPDGGMTYLFSVDHVRFFLAPQGTEVRLPGYEYKTLRELRELAAGRNLFAAFTAYHLWKWYRDNCRCGRCGGGNEPHPAERALRCRQCGHVIYPRINPAVIVGVIRGDCLLITRYRTGYAHNALVAGFAEIGETLEQTVQREVMEETGIRVKNIRYYRSQPWGIAQDLLVGFFCEAEEPAEIRMDPRELKYAEWVSREEIVLQPTDLSLTNDMMKFFKRNGKV